MGFYERYIERLSADYPQTVTRLDLRERLSPNLVSSHHLILPASVKAEAERIVKAFSELRASTAYRERTYAKARAEGHEPFDPGNFSALMCYDFHLTPEGHLKLIEINTNASMALIVDVLYRCEGVENTFAGDMRKELFQTFVTEHRLSGAPSLDHVAIVDETPEKQKLFLEFHLYKEMFEQTGLACSILDTKNLTFDGTLEGGGRPVQLVYNRDTDFYLQTSPHADLARAWKSRAACVSPNPHEYLLLADKQRLEDLSPLIEGRGENLSREFGISQESATSIGSTLLKTVDVRSYENSDALWAERKKYFFKPKRSFGGKAVYRGNSVSRTVFEGTVWKGEYIAQEFAPPPTVRLEKSEHTEGGEFKYDLRFFAYQDRIQLAAARLYQGQTTNSQTPGGGATLIRWT